MAINKLFHETDLPIYEYNGEFYLDGEDPHIETEDGFTEQGDSMSFRRSIGVGTNYDYPYLPITEPITTNENYHHGAYKDEDGFLPDFITSIYKDVTAIHLVHHENFVVHQKEDNKRFCVRQVCSECKYYNVCEPVISLIKEERPNTIVSIDLSAQEPLLLSYRSREPNWISTFRNKHLRVTGVLDFLDNIFAKKYDFNVNSMEQAEKYWVFISQFDWNTDRLVNINRLIGEYSESGILSEELNNQLNSLFADYEASIDMLPINTLV